jgi:predicted DCC family thiol-disulfide oxidoreductase YuxK
MGSVSEDVQTEVPTHEPREIVFYDGNCGLCHRAVTFLLGADRAGRAFVFAPLFGDTFSREIPEHVRATIPDSLVLKTHDGQVYVRSEAVLRAMMRLGPLYRWTAIVARIVPRFLRDMIYDGVAKIRHALFARPSDACPLVPPRLRSRFLP